MLKVSPLRVPRLGAPGPRSSSGAVHSSSAVTRQGHTAVTGGPPKLAKLGACFIHVVPSPCPYSPRGGTALPHSQIRVLRLREKKPSTPGHTTGSAGGPGISPSPLPSKRLA